MSSALAFGISAASSCGEPAMSSRVPTAISAGASNGGHVLGLERLARAAQAGRERAQVRLGLLGEEAEGPSHRIGDVVDRRRFERGGNFERKPAPWISAMPAPPRTTDRTTSGWRTESTDEMRAPSE